jgi:cytidyltransferase-like protein
MTQTKKPVKVFVSGCYDIIHAGHVQFFEDAKALGDHLTVCFASNAVLLLSKKRESALPEDNKKALLASLRPVDEVVSSSDLHPIFDFVQHVERIRPNILAVTEDDRNVEVKREFCLKYGIQLVILPKRSTVTQASTTSIRSKIREVESVPLRVDFGGGWLDVPKFSKEGAYIVNCAISPLVSLTSWPYEKGAGLGGSAAYAILQAKQGARAELDMGVGWQDPAIINHTGLCVWRSGKLPIVDVQLNPDWLEGKMLIYWTGNDHKSFDHVSRKRDYAKIVRAGKTAREGALKSSLPILAKAINLSYEAQLGEGMNKLPTVKKAIARKYLGGGHGGYALYLFKNKKDRDAALKSVKGTLKIEPYIKTVL